MGWLRALFSSLIKGKRPPIVTIMGHVDHGKTTLLDRLRSSNVAAGEAGGITQHLGAFTVRLGDTGASVCFLDTPGHAAFKAVRERGALATDIVVLVIALDDGVMPQTREVIKLAKSRSVPFVVALSKMDVFGATMITERSRKIAHVLCEEDIELEGLIGQGNVQAVPISGITGQGIDDLILAISAEAEMLEEKLDINYTSPGSGFVLEAKQSRGIGDVASVILKNGQIRLGDWIVAGGSYGRVKQICSEHHTAIDCLYPSVPALLSGWRSSPPAGEELVVVSSESEARELCSLIISDQQTGAYNEHLRVSEERSIAQRHLLEEYRKRLTDRSKRVVKVLESSELEEGKPTLDVILKADVLGSIEALKQALQGIPQGKARINIVDCSIGGLSDRDIELARCCKHPTILFFNQEISKTMLKSLKHHRIPFQSYNIIYSLLDGVRGQLRDLLPKAESAEVVGEATIKQLFQIDAKPPQVIAGCMVNHGTLQHGRIAKTGERFSYRILRKDSIVFDGPLKSMRHGKNEVKSVQAGMECGLSFEGFSEMIVSDSVQQVRVYGVMPELE